MNKRRNCKRTLVMALALSLTATSLVGCGSQYTAEDLVAANHSSLANVAELKDYYAEQLGYDSIITRGVQPTHLELMEVSGTKADVLKQLQEKVAKVLAEDEYKVDKETSLLISEDTFNYIKSEIDGLALSNPKVTAVQGAIGYYFVDVEYDVKAQSPGTFKPSSNMLGLNGVWTHTQDGSYKLSMEYIKTAVYRLNKYFYDNALSYEAEWDEGDEIIKIYKSDANKIKKEHDDAYINQVTGNVGVEQTERVEGAEAERSEDIEGVEHDGEVDPSSDDGVDTSGMAGTLSEPTAPLEINEEDLLKKSVAENSTIQDPNRRVQIDVNFINSVVGYSLVQSAFLPELDAVYEKPKKDGEICGFGIYPEGVNGLRIWDFDRSQISGKATLRFTFKDSIKGKQKMTGEGVYLSTLELDNGISSLTGSTNVAKYVGDALSATVERADRLQSNCDIAQMLSDTVYEDKGYGILRGYKDICSSQLKYMSTIRQVLASDTVNNAYLVEVETTVMSGDKTVDTYGTFKDKSYVVVQLQDENWVVADTIRFSRETVKEPEVNPDNAVRKRLISLNQYEPFNTPENEANKPVLLGLMKDLYLACSNKQYSLTKQDIEDHGVTDYKGMTRGIVECFNTDTTILSEDDREYQISKVMQLLTGKFGSDVDPSMSGTVTEWVGGTEKQAEFITEELVTYSGLNTGYYMQVYYLVSTTGGEWTIDERNIIDEYEVEGDELNNIKSRLGVS